VELRGLEPLAC